MFNTIVSLIFGTVSTESNQDAFLDELNYIWSGVELECYNQHFDAWIPGNIDFVIDSPFNGDASLRAYWVAYDGSFTRYVLLDEIEDLFAEVLQ